ncbi:MAG: hypothetical protein MZW92_05810 [Comamonadaceae bacterium]|nr:hypothetical protein [Comamonadaceae bacterium]
MVRRRRASIGSYSSTCSRRHRSSASSKPWPPASNGPAAEGKDLKINLVLSDTRESYVLWIENAVLHHKKAAPAADANATLTLTKPIFIKMMAGTAGVKDTLLSETSNRRQQDRPDPLLPCSKKRQVHSPS